MFQLPPIRRRLPRLMRWLLLASAALLTLAVIFVLYSWDNDSLRSDLTDMTTSRSVTVPAQAAIGNDVSTPTPILAPALASQPTNTVAITQLPAVVDTPVPSVAAIQPPIATPVMPPPRSIATLAPAATPTATPWYEGGTLRTATPDEWRAATPEDKLATAAYWINRIYRPYWQTPDELLTLSTELMTCIDDIAATGIQAWEGDSLGTGPVVACILQMMEKR